jgi:hypothetical protein
VLGQSDAQAFEIDPVELADREQTWRPYRRRSSDGPGRFEQIGRQRLGGWG